jgi:predicted permease
MTPSRHVTPRHGGDDRDDRDDRAPELEAELQFHHDTTVAELRRQGLSAEEADREAARRFGDRATWQARILRTMRGRQTLGARLAAGRQGVAAVARDVRYAARTLARTRLFTLSTSGVFALGLGALTIVLALVHGILLTPLPYPDADRLVYIWGRNPNARAGFLNLPVSEPDLNDWRHQTTHLAAVGGAVPDTATLTGDGEPERLAAVAVVGDLFDALAVRPLFGRTLRAEDATDARRPVVLGHALWTRRFAGDPAVIGRTILLDDRPHEVVGVMPSGFAFPRTQEISANYGFAADVAVYRPWQTGAAGPMVRGNRYIVAAARLAPDASVPQAEREIAAIAAVSTGRAPDAATGDSFALVPFREQATAGVRGIVWLVLAAAAMVLAIACLNVSHLLLVRVRGRQHEFAVRSCLGAGRFSLIRQILIEALLLAALGGLAGLGGASLVLNVLVTRAPADLPRLEAIGLGGWVCGVLAGVVGLAGLCAGSAAALAVGSRPFKAALRETGRASSAGAGSSRLLIGVEVALSVVLLIGAGLLVRSLERVLTTSPGFSAGHVLTFQASLPAARYPSGEDVRRGYDLMLHAIRGVNGVASAAYTWQLPMTGSQGSTSYSRENGEGGGLVLIHRVSPAYFDVMGMRIVRGRTLDPAGDLPPVVVNEAAVRAQWSDQDPLDQIVIINGVRSRIVGVVNDVRHGSLEQSPSPEMYRQAFLRSMFLAIRTVAPPRSVLSEVRTAVGRVDPAMPLGDIRTMDERMSATTARRRFVVLGIGIFAGLALALAVVGLYGVTAMLVARRRREVGIRIAIGATPGRAVSLLMRQTGIIVLGGLATGITIAILLARYLAPFLYDTTPRDPVIYLLVTAGLGTAATLAAYLPARRAAAVDPASVLRAD